MALQLDEWTHTNVVRLAHGKLSLIRIFRWYVRILRSITIGYHKHAEDSFSFQQRTKGTEYTEKINLKLTTVLNFEISASTPLQLTLLLKFALPSKHLAFLIA